MTWQMAASVKGLEDCWEREQKDVGEREGREWLCSIQNRWDVVESVRQEVAEGSGLDEDCAVGVWVELTARGNGQNTSLNPHVVHFTQQRTAIVILDESEPERVTNVILNIQWYISLKHYNSNLFQSEKSNDKPKGLKWTLQIPAERSEALCRCWYVWSVKDRSFTMVVCNSWKGRSA